MEFDEVTERCAECDGHWHHFPDCSWFSEADRAHWERKRQWYAANGWKEVSPGGGWVSPGPEQDALLERLRQKR
jgi:hypothetical protein